MHESGVDAALRKSSFGNWESLGRVTVAMARIS